MSAVRFVRALLPLLFALLLAGCDADIDMEYSRRRAFLRITPVTSAAPLYKALKNTGIFCRITYDAKYYYFHPQTGETTVMARTALDAYGTPVSIAGFIVGTPSMADFKGIIAPLVFDLACPSCYEYDAIHRALDFEGLEAVRCSRCKRLYSLTNKGIIIEGEKGKPMKQYHFSYEGDVFVVQN